MGLGVVIEVVVVVARMGVRREMVRRSSEVNILWLWFWSGGG